MKERSNLRNRKYTILAFVIAGRFLCRLNRFAESDFGIAVL